MGVGIRSREATFDDRGTHLNQLKGEQQMQGKQRRILAGGGLIAAVLLVGAMWPRPATTMPTVTVYKAPT